MASLAALLARLKDRPLLVALLIGVAAQTLFSVHLGRPGRLVFDEVHYVPAARALLALNEPHNTEHPLLAKTLIALGMAIFGDGPIGWRAMSTLAGTATVLAAFAFLFLLFGRIRPAASGALFVAINQLVFVHARIAMLDPFLGAFTMAGIAALLWAMRSPRRALPIWVLGSALLGLATGVKWAAAPYVAFAAIAFIAVRLRDARLAGRPALSALSGQNQPHWPGLDTMPALLLLGTVSIAAYFLTFLPAFFYARDAMTLGELLPFQSAMYEAQTQVLNPHPYQSSWWSWPLMLRPIWYFYEPDTGWVRGVLLIGNPAIMWGGLVAVLACLVGWLRSRDPKPLAVASLWIASFAVWAIIPKSLGFYYYYHLSAIFVALALAAAFEHWRTPRLQLGVALLALALFAYFYPILSGAPLTDDQQFNHWMWFDSWR